MRIACIATSRIPSLTANSIQVMKVCQAMSELGHEVQLWTAGRAPIGGWQALSSHYGLRRGFPIVWLGGFPPARRYDVCLRAVLAALRWRADVYYAWPLPAAAAASTLGVPTVLEVHDRPAGHFGPWLLRRFLRGRGARRLLPTTTGLQDWLAEAYRLALRPPFCLVSPNGVDLERYEGLPSPSAARRSLGLAEGFTAGYTGHLYAGRGIALILDLAGRNPDMRFVLAGGDPAAVEAWRAQARGAQLQNVVFLGFVPNERLPLVQAACDVLLMPYERRIAVSGGGDTSQTASPMKVFEYLAAGRAILSSDLPVLREQLSDENAVLLPADDAGAWEAALRSLREDPARRERLATRAARAARDHSWSARAQRALEGLSDVGRLA